MHWKAEAPADTLALGQVLHLNANIHILAGVNPEGPPLLHQSQTDHQYD